MEQQESFVANASHELRTPLTSLQTNLEVNSADPNLDKKTKAILEENLEDVTQLVTLTDRLLKLARPDTDQEQLRSSFSRVSFATLIGQVKKKLSPTLKKKTTKIKTSSA